MRIDLSQKLSRNIIDINKKEIIEIKQNFLILITIEDRGIPRTWEIIQWNDDKIRLYKND